MNQYFCYVLNQEGDVNACEMLDGSNGNEAFGRAQSYLAQHPSIPAVEVWLENRYVGKLHQPLAAKWARILHGPELPASLALTVPRR
jgi:hypothetical protein